MQKDNINIIDIGLKYLGMGYIKVVAYNLTHNYYFYREDGGSSDIDRLYNYNKLLFKDTTNIFSVKLGFTFVEFFAQVHGELPEKECLF